jgi:DNA-binding PucR family transcriptional regulator
MKDNMLDKNEAAENAEDTQDSELSVEDIAFILQSLWKANALMKVSAYSADLDEGQVADIVDDHEEAVKRLSRTLIGSARSLKKASRKSKP